MAGVIAAGAEFAEFAQYVASVAGTSRATLTSLGAAGFSYEALVHLKELRDAGVDIYDHIRDIVSKHKSAVVPETPQHSRPTPPTISPGQPSPNLRHRINFRDIHGASSGELHAPVENGADDTSQFPPGTTADTRSAVNMAATHQFNTGDEVPVVPPPAKIAKIIPDYTTIKMPWHAYQGYFFNNNVRSNGLFIRLNSIQDPSHSFTWHRPNPYATWNTLYKYYRVLACDVHIRYNFVKGEQPYQDLFTTGTGGTPYESPMASNMFSMICGYAPTDDASDIYPNAVAAIEGKHSKNMWLDPRDAEFSGADGVVRYFGGVRECDYHYSPETWDYHIRDNVHDSRWTLLNSNPEESHLLHVYCMNANRASEATRDMKRWVRVDVNCSYTVQLREHSLSRDHEATDV
jgi:hypothetical protein